MLVLQAGGARLVNVLALARNENVPRHVHRRSVNSIVGRQRSSGDTSGGVGGSGGGGGRGLGNGGAAARVDELAERDVVFLHGRGAPATDMVGRLSGERVVLGHGEMVRGLGMLMVVWGWISEFRWERVGEEVRDR